MSKVSVYEEGEPLVSDKRLEQVFDRLTKLADKPPEGLSFLTKRQDEKQAPDGTTQGALAVFIVTSPHPSQDKRLVITPSMLISIATMPYQQWVEANKEYRHYANLTDPLRPIFAGLLRQHLTHRENLESLQNN